MAKNSVVGAVLGGLKISIQLVTLPVIASYLGPKEFAVYALALPAITFFLVLADAGVGGTLSREDEANEIVWSSSFWAILILCFLLQIVVIFIGLLIAYISDEPSLSKLMILLSFSLPIMGITNVPAARLNRRGRIQYLAVCDLFSSALGAFCGIICSIKGMGAISLGFQFVVSFLSRSFLINLAAFHMPLFHFSYKAVTKHIVVSTTIVCSRLTEFVGRAVENIVFQNIYGSALLGNYNLGSQISRFSCEAVGNPVWASLYAQALHEDRSRLAELTRRTLVTVCYVLFPIAALLITSSAPLFSIIMGNKWNDAAWIVEVLIFFNALSTVFGLIGAVLTAIGAPLSILYALGLLYLSRILSVVAGAVFGVYFSVLAIGLSSLVFIVVLTIGAGRKFGFNFYSLSSIRKPFEASLAVALANYLMISYLPGSIFYLLISYLLAGILYTILVYLIDDPDLSPLLSKFRGRLR
ncbi:oligosaccharide flippase family protein [Methylobacterium sp. J-001]|uniref:oligosaccharide flippase family protein n=1 Tax=Methylobacterium sp. J-001 TaxID=2836609 RepID=UPI001FB99348|nr:oligosaccharide flippase family protein [Methylobacterium sp. J-001]MCJ2115665.1 oligosaccharide flippase family protein [Methylobacterium sp. J-001]